MGMFTNKKPKRPNICDYKMQSLQPDFSAGRDHEGEEEEEQEPGQAPLKEQREEVQEQEQQGQRQQEEQEQRQKGGEKQKQGSPPAGGQVTFGKQGEVQEQGEKVNYKIVRLNLPPCHFLKKQCLDILCPSLITSYLEQFES